MRITDVKTVLLTGPSGHDPYLQFIRKCRSAAFVEIHTDTDLVGIGETLTGYHAPEIVPEIVDFFKPILVNISDKEINPRRLWDRMYRCANFWSRTGVGVNVLAGIEGALWDLKGKMEGEPVYELLGGRVHDRLFCYATGCQSDYPWEHLIRKIGLYHEEGFRAVKIGGGWYNSSTRTSFVSENVQAWIDMESEKLQAVRRQVGKDIAICLDGQMSNVDEGKVGWNVGTARAVLKALEQYDLFFYEEPLHYNDIAGYAELCRSTSVPVAGGEAIFTREEFGQYTQARALDIAQIDASLIGIWAFLDIARMFGLQGRRVATHSWGAGAAVMENIHAAFATPNIAILEIPPLAGGMHTDIYADGYRFKDSYILPPEGPGLGVRLTDAIKAKYPFVRGSGEWNAVPGKFEYM
jgi:L-alanine-DL-glutamate epimerase-like enolase superfamily enzyme